MPKGCKGVSTAARHIVVAEMLRCRPQMCGGALEFRGGTFLCAALSKASSDIYFPFRISANASHCSLLTSSKILNSPAPQAFSPPSI